MREQTAYSAKYNANNHELIIAGSLRPHGDSELDHLYTRLAEATTDARGVLYVNLTRLRQLNHTGFAHLTRIVRDTTASHPDLDIKLIVSSVTPWAVPRFEHLASLWPKVTLKQHDRAFYPGQQVIDSDEFIPVLRTQTELLWSHEKDMLTAHGLKPGMRVADICCGIGDFAVLLRKNFDPEVIVGIDHSQRFLQYASTVRDEFQTDRVEYRFGDATHLLLPDASFDFVLCRLSLQVFDRPEQITHELYRICKPGGRVYITNELMTHNVGYPHRESIYNGFHAMLDISRQLGIDFDMGPKSAVYLKDEGFDDVKINIIDVNNTNSDPDDFARVVESWNIYVTNTMAPATKASPDELEAFRGGAEDFIGAIRHRRGFASWPIYLATARRPDQ